MPVANFDPVKNYVNQLKEAFIEIALFYYDSFGGTKIFVQFKPTLLNDLNKQQPQQQEANGNNKLNLNYKLYNKETKRLEINLNSIIDDMKIFGNELVESIKINQRFENKFLN